MPYIPEEAREEIRAGRPPANAGELNYSFYLISKAYFENNPRYQSINDVIGALHGAAYEFERRIVFPYEDSKINENGDI